MTKELEIGFYTGGEPIEKITQYFIQLDGQATDGASYQMTYGSIGAARNSVNQLFKYDYHKYGFKSAKEMREYLEKEGRLLYIEIQL